jgi:hypothetical protein
MVCPSDALFDSIGDFSKPKNGIPAIPLDADDERGDVGLQKEHRSGESDGFFEKVFIRSAARRKQENPDR